MAAMFNYECPKIGIRFAEALLPQISSEVGLDYNLPHVHSDKLEFDYATYTCKGLQPMSGDARHLKDDRIGSAWVFSGLSQQHRAYLGFGGVGFELGDGGLISGHEGASRTYYTAHAVGGLYLAAVLSFVNNSGIHPRPRPGSYFRLAGSC
jgi:hypothetical protein